MDDCNVSDLDWLLVLSHYEPKQHTMAWPNSYNELFEPIIQPIILTITIHAQHTHRIQLV